MSNQAGKKLENEMESGSICNSFDRSGLRGNWRNPCAYKIRLCAAFWYHDPQAPNPNFQSAPGRLDMSPVAS